MNKTEKDIEKTKSKSMPTSSNPSSSSPPSFQDFLEITRTRIQKGETPTWVVLGNEAADLDSTVSCLITSYGLFLRDTSHHSLCVPMLPLHRRKFSLRKDIVEYFRTLHLPWETSLYFLEDFQSFPLGETAVNVFLVDTNTIPTPMALYASQLNVQGILDHHEDHAKFLLIHPRKVCRVMSATSLVVLEFFPTFQEWKVNVTSLTLMSKLALGALLMDTHDWRSNTHLDTEAYQECLPYLEHTHSPVSSPSALYQQLQYWKTEGPFSVSEWLEKDMKWYMNEKVGKYVMASIPFSMLPWFQSTTTSADIHRFFCDVLQPEGCVLLSILATDMKTQTLHQDQASKMDPERHLYYHTKWASLGVALETKVKELPHLFSPCTIPEHPLEWTGKCYRIELGNMSRKKLQPEFDKLLLSVSEDLDISQYKYQ